MSKPSDLDIRNGCLIILAAAVLAAALAVGLLVRGANSDGAPPAPGGPSVVPSPLTHPGPNWTGVPQGGR